MTEPFFSRLRFPRRPVGARLVLTLLVSVFTQGCGCSTGQPGLLQLPGTGGTEAVGDGLPGVGGMLSGGSGGQAATGGVGGGGGGSTGSGATNGNELPPIPSVMINELVVYPRNDWSHSRRLAGRSPYSYPPSSGNINGLDQYVELINYEQVPVDLRGWLLRCVDTVPNTTEFGVGDAALVFEEGSSIERYVGSDQGALMVLGNPDGYISTDAYIELIDSHGRVVDSLEVGGLLESRDFEADGIGDGAPGEGRNGFSRGSFDEAIARPDGALDTDDDQADFVAMQATPMQHNLPYVVADDGPPSLVAHTQGGDVRVSDPIEIRFDDAIDAVSADAAIRVLDAGRWISLGPVTLAQVDPADPDHVVHIWPVGRLPFDADIEVQVSGGPDGLRDQAGEQLQADETFVFHTEAAPADPGDVLINEVATTPMADWGDTMPGDDGDGIPFSPVPGIAEPETGDEYIELLVLRPGVTNLQAYEIVIYNGPSLLGPARESSSFSSTGVVTVVPEMATIGAVPEGSHVVMGNPVGSLSSSTWLELRDGSGVLVDTVEIGGTSSGLDRGGDGVDNGAPGPGLTGMGLDAQSEVVARFPDGVDTGSDVADWAPAPATPGLSNGS